MINELITYRLTADLFFVALLGSCRLLGLGFCASDLLIGVCQLAHQICLRRAALGSSVLAELTLDGCTFSLCRGLQAEQAEDSNSWYALIWTDDLLTPWVDLPKNVRSKQRDE